MPTKQRLHMIRPKATPKLSENFGGSLASPSPHTPLHHPLSPHQPKPLYQIFHSDSRDRQCTNDYSEVASA
ncbi:hypothetical protein EVAR_41446_1 [Eumeta japonica]|uniref:Uncharacterized protein n=1 Tax=Eumeta variegata TaxID=151549 RepID=A0A4C1W508_EUMVA|nr:hypothetical protein EVAR_41446_1 [Eumeta japonica]